MKTWKSIVIVSVFFSIGVLGHAEESFAQSEKSIGQLVSEAKTAAEHKAIAVLYEKESAKFQQEAKQHEELAKQLTTEAGGQAPFASHHYERADHCRRLADSLGKAAQEAQALAKIHESLAQSSTEGKK